MARRTLTKKQKLGIAAAVAVVVLTLVIVLVSVLGSTNKDGEQDTTTTTSAAGDVAIQTTPPEQQAEATTEAEWLIEPRLVLYFKTEEGFMDAEFTDRTFAKLEDAKTITFSDTAKVNGEYAEPEVRLYGVPLGAFVSVTCESIVTKAEYLYVGQNDGAYQYYYWQPRMYAASEQGEYTFKLTIKEAEDSNAETVIYYKMAV